jgi:23S rRNA (uridine2552-2'-O)-methyltransferase
MKKYQDHYFKRAKQENYPARSVYKLEEIDKRFSLLGTGQRVLDLGAAPGSWSLYAAKRVGPKGVVVAVDLQEARTALPDNVSWRQEDAFEPSEALRAEMDDVGPFHVVLSDMAPKTTGHKFTDQSRSLDLARAALALAQGCLLHGGHFAVKVFMGPDVKAYTDEMRAVFAQVKTFKPKSSRSESKEIFYVAQGFKGRADR